jgi:hypothetical protein
VVAVQDPDDYLAVVMAKSKRKTDDAVTLAADRSSKLPNRSAHVTDSDIARRAYDLYLTRGCEHGHEVDDWLQAECELREGGEFHRQV